MNYRKKYNSIILCLQKAKSLEFSTSILSYAIDKYERNKPMIDHSEESVSKTYSELISILMKHSEQKYTFDINGDLHSKDDKPSLVDESNSLQVWTHHGKIHRTSGPAVVNLTTEEWWINDEDITKQLSNWCDSQGFSLKNLSSDDLLLVKLMLENFYKNGNFSD